MEFIKKYRYYLILGIALVLGILLIILGVIKREEHVIVVDDKLYYINLIGDKEITLYVGDTFVEPGYTGTDDIGNDLTKEVVISNNIDNNTIGNYKVSYTLGNITKERNVKVIEKPQGATYIYLYGDVNVFLYVGDTYEEKGYEVIDTFEGSKLKDKVIVNSNVDTSHEGIYKIIYSVVNTSGITVSKERTVIVTDKNISLLPSITNITNSNVKINIYVKDELFDYLILPNNKKVTERISTYEVSSNGTYTFTMYNNNGDKTEKKITINNIDREVPSGSCSGSYSNGISNINIKANDNNGISRYILNGTTYTTNNIKVNEELKNVTITIYDVAGNSKDISCNLEDKNFYGDVKNIDLRYSPKYIISNYDNISLNYYVSSSNKGFSYWVYLPKKVSSNLPIIMYMGGLGEIGDDYASDSKGAINNGPIREVISYGYNYNAILVHVQVPSNKYVYEHLGSYVELVGKIANEFKADKKRISVMGFSHGCYGVMNLIPDYQTYFSAAVPIGCDPKDRARYFVQTPTWAFAGGGDGVSSMPRFVSSINALGGSAKFDRPPYHQHNIVGSEYSILRDDNYNVIEWMISQTRK